MTETILPDGWRRPSGYSEGVVGSLGAPLHVAGQMGLRRGARSVDANDGFAEQWRLALDRIRTIVQSAGGTVEDIIALRIYVIDLDAYRSSLKELSAGYGETLGQHFPATTLVEVAGLLDKAALVEIEAEATVKRSAP